MNLPLHACVQNILINYIMNLFEVESASKIYLNITSYILRLWYFRMLRLYYNHQGKVVMDHWSYWSCALRSTIPSSIHGSIFYWEKRIFLDWGGWREGWKWDLESSASLVRTVQQGLWAELQNRRHRRVRRSRVNRGPCRKHGAQVYGQKVLNFSVKQTMTGAVFL